MTGTDEGRTRRRKRRLLAIGGALFAVATASSFLVGAFVASPAELAAEARPPQPSVITAKVERRTIKDVVQSSGEARPESVVPVVVAAPEASDRDPLVTRTKVAVGQEVRSGDVVAEIAGRPVLVMSGDVPMYRDLHLGDSGDDVAQLQQSLRSTGLSVADAKGVLGRSTQVALEARYRRAGYSAPMTSAKVGTSSTTPTGGEGDAAAIAGTVATAPVVLPRSEAFFTPSLPAVVVSIDAQVGKRVDKSVVTLGTESHVVDASFSSGASVAVGQHAEITSNGSDMAGTVVSIDQPSTQQPGSSTATGGVVVTIRPDVAADQRAIGSSSDLRVTVTTKSSEGDVLAVPLLAVTSRADGTSSVTVASGATTHELTVRTGVHAGGFVEVAPVGGTLSPGDDVIIPNAPGS